VPGITTHYRATPDRLGRYPVVCNLLCGLGHSTMRANLIVLPKGTFNAWLAKQQVLAAHGLGGAAAGAASASIAAPTAPAASSGHTNVTRFVAGGGG